MGWGKVIKSSSDTSLPSQAESKAGEKVAKGSVWSSFSGSWGKGEPETEKAPVQTEPVSKAPVSAEPVSNQPRKTTATEGEGGHRQTSLSREPSQSQSTLGGNQSEGAMRREQSESSLMEDCGEEELLSSELGCNTR